MLLLFFNIVLLSRVKKVNILESFYCICLSLLIEYVTRLRRDKRLLSSMVEQSAVNRSVVGSSPIASATGLLEKRLNSYPFQGYIHGFESRTGHQ